MWLIVDGLLTSGRGENYKLRARNNNVKYNPLLFKAKVVTHTYMTIYLFFLDFITIIIILSC